MPPPSLPGALRRALLRPRPNPLPTLPLPPNTTTKPFSTTPAPPATFTRTRMPQRPKHPPESEFEESFLKGSGPGGQKIVRLSSPFPISPPTCPSPPPPVTPPSRTYPRPPPPLEQNLVRRPAQTPPHGHRHQVPGDAVARAEPQDGARPARRAARRAVQRRGEPDRHRGDRQEEARRQRRQEEPAQVQEIGGGEGGGTTIIRGGPRAGDRGTRGSRGECPKAGPSPVVVGTTDGCHDT